MSSPALACDVFVSGAMDLEQSSFFDKLMFIIQLKPKGLTFPEVEDEIFQLGNDAKTVADLREYLAAGKDVFVGEQNWFWVGPDEEKAFVEPLPYPFNDINARVELIWTQEDVTFDAAAQRILSVHDTVFCDAELVKLSLVDLRIIRYCKNAAMASKKADLVASILADQDVKGLHTVRVVQKTLGVYR